MGSRSRAGALGRKAAQEGSRSATRFTLLVGAITLTAGPALAEPFVVLPPRGAGHLVGDGESRTAVTLLVDVDMLGVIAGERLATWPDRLFGLEPGEPVLARARLGGRIDLCAAPVSFVLRLDVAEFMRNPVGPTGDAAIDAFVGQEVGASVGAVIDDLYVYAQPDRFDLQVGRARVPFSRARQREESALPLGIVPFVVDRVTPDRRWGVTVVRQRGALSTMAGAYEDLDELEPRTSDGDAIGVLGVAWDGPVTVEGQGLVRADEAGWLALSAAGQAGRVLWVAEGLAGREEESWQVAGWAGARLQVVGPFAVGAQLEWDGGNGEEGRWTLAGRIAYLVRGNASSEVSVLAWAQQDVETGAPYDAVVLLLRAAL